MLIIAGLVVPTTTSSPTSRASFPATASSTVVRILEGGVETSIVSIRNTYGTMLKKELSNNKSR